VMTTGRVKCWGANYDGQLGAGYTGLNENSPIWVTGIGTAVDESCG